MTHIPEFPPNWNDFGPGNPFELEPPLPRFLWNPWLTTEQRTELETEAGEWAAHRAEKMVPSGYGFEWVKHKALAMVEGYMGAPLPKVKIRRARKRKEKLAPLVGMLTPEVEEGLTQTVLDAIMIGIEINHRRPSTEEIQEKVLEVIDWAEEDGITIGKAKAKSIVDNALARVDAELARRAPARRART